MHYMLNIETKIDFLLSEDAILDLHNGNASVFVPDGINVSGALSRTTSLCIAAHQDDTEIMAYNAIIEAYNKKDNWFASVIVTDGSGSPRNGEYADFNDDEIKAVRVKEQNKAAMMGKYSVQFQLGYQSAEIKKPSNHNLICDIKNIISASCPKVVYTHNLADKHDTHVAVALHTINALRQMQFLPQLFGMEVWRNLDWLQDKEKVVFDASDNEELAAELLGLFDSQIAGGKRYDIAVLGRRRANAAFHVGRNTDSLSSAIFGVDMTELLLCPDIKLEEFISKQIDGFKQETLAKISKLNVSV